MRICITGGSGSLGRALLYHLTTSGADRIVTMTRDEQKRAALLRDFGWYPGLRVFAGDVRDRERMTDIFADCEVVVHAAARKVVTGHHDEPFEMHRTNVEGTLNVIAAARTAGVRKVLFISSDKAVCPTNVYGISKALAEHMVVSANAKTFASGLRLGVLRYGNVIASNGSVVRVWRECVEQRRPLPLSDVRMTRFWLTLDQAVGYVLRAVADLRGGEIFVPLLRAAPVTDLVAAIAPDAPIELLGVRPGGEKLHEELLSADSVRRAVRRNGFFVVTPPRTADSWDTASWLGEPVPEHLMYRSDVWPDRWTVDGLREALAC